MTAAPLGVEALQIRAVTGLPIYIVPLGYTKPPLSLNDRHGYRTKAKITREVRVRVAQKLRALIGRPSAIVPHIHVVLHYVPKDRRTRDTDNLVATLKPCIDALTASGKPGLAQTPLVEDDDPDHVTWSPPKIHAPDDAGPRMWLEIRCAAAAPVTT